MAALGTETSGSILSPSQRNNLVGIKPTVGLTSRYLVIPIASTQDTVGPMARTVKDAAYVLSAINSQNDPHDNYTSVNPFPPGFDFTAGCKPHALKGLRIGIPRNGITPSANQSLTIGPEIDAFNKSIAIFKAAGATIVDNADFPNLTQYRTANSTVVLGVEFIAEMIDYFHSLTYNPNNISTFDELVNFTTSDPREVYPDRDIARWVSAQALNLTKSSPRYLYERYNDLVAGSNSTILGALEKYDLDVLIMPSSFSAGVAAIAGYPVVTVSLPVALFVQHNVCVSLLT
jgi:amidase